MTSMEAESREEKEDEITCPLSVSNAVVVVGMSVMGGDGVSSVAIKDFVR